MRSSKLTIKKIFSIGALAATMFTRAEAAPPTQGLTFDSYLQLTSSELFQFMGHISQPTIYLDQFSCPGLDGQITAAACSANTIIIGSKFMQDKANNYGPLVIKAILAHEWGHTIQLTRKFQYVAPYFELQADCIAGSFIKYSETTWSYPSFIEAAARNFREGTAFVNGTYDYHGSPSQRDFATRDGYANGLKGCGVL